MAAVERRELPGMLAAPPMTRKRAGASGVDLHAHRDDLAAIVRAVVAEPDLTPRRLDHILKAHPRGGRGLYPRDAVVAAYRAFAGRDGLPPFDPAVLDRLRLNPVRSRSGVTPVAVLTRPYPCPGACVFCPTDARMPKSYLADEPGAQRAARQAFDPYRQAWVRLAALHAAGHPVDKVELIVLGGTWSAYPEPYQIWFVKRLFDALNDFGARNDDGAPMGGGTPLATATTATTTTAATAIPTPTTPTTATPAAGPGTPDGRAAWRELHAAHAANEAAACRCVGLSVETRPDHVDPAEVRRLRHLGVTKVQIGIQSLDDAVLAANRRGHDVAATRRAMRLLRRAGFKLHAHWMPNLLGATPDGDLADYLRLWDDPDVRPDELKIYPCALVATAELVAHHRAGRWRPYPRAALVDLLADCFTATPPWCRLTRVIRDIPATDIVAGDIPTNLRQAVERRLAERGRASHDIRAREVRGRAVDAGALVLDVLRYRAGGGEEVFLQLVTPGPDARLAAFLRLFLPDPAEPPVFDVLAGAAIIREVHVYGQAVEIGAALPGKAQHAGLGGRLVAAAARLAAGGGHPRLAVISAVGTRPYYRRLGFVDAGPYQVMPLGRGGAPAAAGV